MANVASTGLGVMAGRAMDRTFFGGSSSAAPAEGDSEAAPAQYEEYQVAADQGLADPSLSDSVCAREVMEFKKCMERTSSDVTACQWNIDILAACQRQQQDLGFANAGRF